MSDQESKAASCTEEGTNVLRFTGTAGRAAVKREVLPTDPFTPEERKELRELMAWLRINQPVIEAAKTRCTILSRLTQG